MYHQISGDDSPASEKDTKQLPSSNALSWYRVMHTCGGSIWTTLLALPHISDLNESPINALNFVPKLQNVSPIVPEQDPESASAPPGTFNAPKLWRDFQLDQKWHLIGLMLLYVFFGFVDKADRCCFEMIGIVRLMLVMVSFRTKSCLSGSRCDLQFNVIKIINCISEFSSNSNHQ